MADLTKFRLSIHRPCDECEGKGHHVRQPGPLNHDLNEWVKHIENRQIKISDVKDEFDRLPKEIPGVTDRVSHFRCIKCQGTGEIQTHITLAELQALLRSG